MVVKSARKRLQADGMFIFVTLFAAIGGFAVVGSFADHQPIETFNRGSYSLAQYASGAKNTYRLGLNKDLSYCFNASAGGVSVMIVGAAAPRRFELTPSSGGESCFRTDANYSRATVVLPAQLSSATTLTVR